MYTMGIKWIWSLRYENISYFFLLYFQSLQHTERFLGFHRFLSGGRRPTDWSWGSSADRHQWGDQSTSGWSLPDQRILVGTGEVVVRRGQHGCQFSVFQDHRLGILHWADYVWNHRWESKEVCFDLCNVNRFAICKDFAVTITETLSCGRRLMGSRIIGSIG